MERGAKEEGSDGIRVITPNAGWSYHRLATPCVNNVMTVTTARRQQATQITAHRSNLSSSRMEIESKAKFTCLGSCAFVTQLERVPRTNFASLLRRLSDTVTSTPHPAISDRAHILARGRKLSTARPTTLQAFVDV